jgi:hypothetical protein
MRGIMHYDVEFRREESTSRSRLSREALKSVQVDLSSADQFDPTPMLDRPGGICGCCQNIIINQIRAFLLETTSAMRKRSATPRSKDKRSCRGFIAAEDPSQLGLG